MHKIQDAAKRETETEIDRERREKHKERERERERESFFSTLPTQECFPHAFDFFFLGCCIPYFVDAESDAKCMMESHTLQSIPRKFQTRFEVFLVSFLSFFFLFFFGWGFVYQNLTDLDKEKKRVMKKQTSDLGYPTASSLQM